MVWLVPGVQVTVCGEAATTLSTTTCNPDGLVVIVIDGLQGVMVYAGCGTELSAKRGTGAVASAEEIPAKGPPAGAWEMFTVTGPRAGRLPVTLNATATGIVATSGTLGSEFTIS